MINLFPYPINKTLGIGKYDPRDMRIKNGKPVVEEGWWRDIKVKKKGGRKK